MAVGWFGLGQLFGGLGRMWVDDMDPQTTLVCPSVCPSVTRRYCVKTKKASVLISKPTGSHTILQGGPIKTAHF